MEELEQPKPFRFHDPRQRRIYEELRQIVGPGPASFFRDVCWLMENPESLHSTAHLVAHLLREIESALRSLFMPVIQEAREEEAVKAILRGIGIADSTPKGRALYKIAGKLSNVVRPDKDQIHKLIDHLIDFLSLSHDSLEAKALFKVIDISITTQREQIRAILKGLDIEEDTREARAWFALADSLHNFAHRRGLNAPFQPDEVRDLWEHAQLLFDVLVKALREHVLEWIPLLDEMLAKPRPTKDDLKRLDQEVPNNAVIRGYFFNRLENPEWLEPLWKSGFFCNPPSVEWDEAQDEPRFPPWPEARYLARMAKHKPEVVKEIILQMPDTRNVHVIYDLADAILNMPPDVAVQLVDKAKEWANSPSLDPLLADKLGALIVHLAQGGQLEAALSLAERLLDILPDPSISDTGAGNALEEFLKPSPEPKAKIDLWYYEQLLKKHIPELVKVAKLDALGLLCDLLDKALRFSQRRREDKTEDYSFWCPAVEEHPPIPRGNLKEALVDGIRDAAELLIREELVSLPEIVELLESRSWPIFHRIALHLLRQFPEEAPDLIADRLTDRALFDSISLYHEYGLLLREQFRMLDPDQQKLILNWIREGPNPKQLERKSKEESEQYKKHWQRDKLYWLQDDLPKEWRRHYEALVEELGEPEHPEFPVPSGTVWIGPTSPKTAEELQRMSVEEIVDFLRRWQPPSELPFEPSPEGLGRELVKVISQTPERFAGEAIKFKDLDPRYVRALICGLREAAKQRKMFDWEPVLELCQWVVEQPREIEGRTVRRLEADPHWGWTRTEIARLLGVGFDKKIIPFNLRSTAWEVLLPITDDPDPTPEDETRSDLNPLELAINTTRGEAIDTVIRYALWVRRHLESLPDGEERIVRGFAEMPEVQKVLERHLDPAQDPSLAVHSMYGRWFSDLALIDLQWARDNAKQIFPLAEQGSAYFKAAWNAYLIFCRPYDSVFEILRDQYHYAVERIGLHRDDVRWPADPDEKLAEHLMELYWRGKIALDDPLLTGFWEKASDGLRGHALSFVGRSLKRTNGDIPLEILKRLKLLWESRIKEIKRNPSAHEKELTAFGWWFVSEKFDMDWAIAQLAESLKLVPKTEPDHIVLEHLGKIVETHPEESVECLRRVIEGDRAGWTIYVSRDRIRKTLEVALRLPSASKKAEKVINVLYSRGFPEFRDLLKR